MGRDLALLELGASLMLGRLRWSFGSSARRSERGRRRPRPGRSEAPGNYWAVLLLDANRVVSTDRLIDALWEDEAPETALKALHVYVSQLRKVVGKERLE